LNIVYSKLFTDAGFVHQNAAQLILQLLMKFRKPTAAAKQPLAVEAVVT
jgi:hypothetical protein